MDEEVIIAAVEADAVFTMHVSVYFISHIKPLKEGFITRFYARKEKKGK